MPTQEKITGPFPLDSDSFWKAMLGKLRVAIGIPFIYSLFFPMVIFDLCLEMYHRICFTIFAIPKIERRKYFIFDRHKLPYLTPIEKLNCLYCSYFNGLVAYAREIGGRTERHWCPIKHVRKRMHEHAHIEKFFDYGSAECYQREKKLIRIYDEESAK
ncbi:MAG: hypothetical protein A3I05_04180 [Deltaproteobacteria bacterium RIFCSPLOWO2_02_FULL_44_10]|nr:MAG: hypothetical protein A3I05_04180 [Deltaproteobacteria bacterium RIFCSPLOWO2_02_FULL_44_10]